MRPHRTSAPDGRRRHRRGRGASAPVLRARAFASSRGTDRARRRELQVRRGSCWPSRVRPGPARRRCCGRWPACCARPPGTSRADGSPVLRSGRPPTATARRGRSGRGAAGQRARHRAHRAARTSVVPMLAAGVAARRPRRAARARRSSGRARGAGHPAGRGAVRRPAAARRGRPRAGPARQGAARRRADQRAGRRQPGEGRRTAAGGGATAARRSCWPRTTRRPRRPATASCTWTTAQPTWVRPLEGRGGGVALGYRAGGDGVGSRARGEPTLDAPDVGRPDGAVTQPADGQPGPGPDVTARSRFVRMRKPLRLPFDPVARAERLWRRRWGAGDSMGAATSIMRVAAAAAGPLRRRRCAPLRPTFARYEALVLLHFSRSDRLPLSVIGERLMVHPTSVTNIVQRLEQAGLVDRVPQPPRRSGHAGRHHAVRARPHAPRDGRPRRARLRSGGAGRARARELFTLLRKVRLHAGDFSDVR